MKKILLAAMMLFAALNSHSQGKESSIEVRGVAKIDREIESYLVDFAIAAEYGEGEGKKAFEDLKNAFLAKAKAAGFEESRFKEDKMGYQALQYYREGSLYTFETRNKEELLKVVKLANGVVVTIVSTRLKYKPVKDSEKLYATAFSDSKEKAATIAKAINKKIGAAITVTDLTSPESISEENFYYKPVTDQYYYLSVKFLIE
ncbi:SIMPL domain-containing protein [Chitinophaga sp. RCC_12]|uniref:SIMPL domain-containing protein n=1 Tax=Chitinophaga sp. RCC_12 TaxID=3239226 RepID=UPI003524C080